MNDHSKTKEQLISEVQDLRKRYSRITDAVTDYFFTVYIENGEAVETVHGPACIAVTGFSSNEFKEMPNLWINMVHENDRNKVNQQAAELLSNHASNPIEHRIVRKDGVVRWVKNTPVVHLDDHNNLISYDGLIRDITEQKTTEKSLQESEARYRAIVQDQSEFIVRWRPDGIRTFVNESYCRYLGKSSDELIGKTIFITIKEEDRGRFLEKIKKLTPEHDSVSEEHRLLHPDGSVRIIQWTDRGIFNDTKELIEVQSVGRDVTEQRKAESALLESEEQFRTLAEESPNMIFINQKGKVVYANKKCEELGYSRQDFYDPQFDFLTLIAPEYQEIIKENFHKHSQGQDVRPYEYALLDKQGKRLETLITTKLMKYQGENAILGIVTDISKQKQVQKALEESESFYREVIENAAGVLFRLIFSDEMGEGTYNYIGSNIENLLGFRPEEFSEKIFHNQIIEIYPRLSSIPTDPQECRKLMRQGKINRYQVDVLVETKTGEKKWLYDSSIPLIDEKTGKVIGSFGILMDITARKKAEEKLRISEERLNLALEATSDGLWDINFGTDEIYYSNRYFTMLGYGPNELPRTQHIWNDLLHPEDKEKAKQKIQNHIQNRTDGYETEFRLKTKSGKWRWILGRGKVVKWGKDGKPERMVGTHVDINKRKDAEEELERARALFQAAIEQSPSGIIVADAPDVKIRIANAASLGIRGKSDRPLTGISVNLHSPTWATFRPDGTSFESKELPLSRAILEGEISQNVDVIIKKDGFEDRWVLANAAPVRNHNNEIIAGIVVFNDITERKLAERALQFRVDFERIIMKISTRFINLPSKEILNGMDKALDEICRFTKVDRSYVILFSKNLKEFSCVSEWVEEGIPEFKTKLQHVSTNLFHWWLEKIKRQEIQFVTNYDELPISEEKVKNYMKTTGTRSLLEIPIVRSGGLIGVLGFTTVKEEKSWPADHIALLKIVAEIFANSLDRNFMEKEIRESEEKYRHLIQYSNDAIYLLYNRKFELINPKFQEMFGFSLDDINQPDFDFIQLVSPKSKSLIEDRAARLAKGEKLSSSYEFTAISKEGQEIEIEASVTHIKYKDGIATQGILRNITERKKLEEQLRQAQKMEAVGRLAGGVAHDFNNLLTAITGYTQLLLLDVESSDKMYSDLNEINRAADRAASLTHQLLAFSRKQILQPQILDLNSIIMELDRMLRRMIGEDIELVTILEPGIGNILADQSQIDQVIMNLAVNSRDAMPTGGKLILETKVITLDKDTKKDGSKVKAGTYVILTVSDNGIGMDEETKSHLFEPFFTTKDVGKGTGLGLATVYGIVRQSGGFIDVDSKQGIGTTLKIYFPQILKEPKNEDEIQKLEKSFSGSETILLVEDEDIVRKLTRKILARYGYHILEASYGEDAIQIINEFLDPVHLIVSDVVMPKMSGVKMAEKIKEKLPDVKILFISGYTEETICKHGTFDSTISFLQKPYTPIDLAKMVRKILDQ